jgi:DNA-binding CsgD family transcriptional regulator
LVGRSSELAALEAELHRASAGEFRCVLLTADAGVGKTRLAAELLSRLPSEVHGLSARAYPLGDTASFGLWAEGLERHLRELPVGEVARLCGGSLVDLAGLLHSAAAVVGSTPEREPPRFRLLEGLAAVLANLAQRAPVVVFLDDVHLADASSWEALGYLARNIASIPVLVVAAARPVELAGHEAATQVLLALDQEGFLGRLDLGPLPAGALRELAGDALRREPPAALVGWLAERSRGNALFALGLLRALEEEGADMSAPRLRHMPEALSERVALRVKALDDSARSTIETLAVLGRRVDLSELATLTLQPLERLGPVLEGLVGTRLVTEEERGRQLTYEITHPLVADGVYQAIGGARRRGLHRHAGRALLAAGHPGEAASHFARSAEPGDDEAIAALCEALRQSEERGAYPEALTVLGSLVELVPEGDPRWLEVLDAMARQPQWVVDHRADAHAALGIPALRAIDAALVRAPDPTRRAGVQLRLASFLCWGMGEFGEADAGYRRAIELFEESGDRSGVLLGRLERGWLATLEGDLQAILTAGREVAKEAAAEGERLALLQALGRAVAYGAYSVGSFDEAESATRTAIALAVDDDNRHAHTIAALFLALTLASQGRIDEAIVWLQRAKALNTEWRETVLLEYEAVVHWHAGDFRSAVAVGEDSVAFHGGRVTRRRALGLGFAALAAVESMQMKQAETLVKFGLAAFGECEWAQYRQCIVHAASVLSWRQGGDREHLDRLRSAPQRLLEMGALPFAAVFLLDAAEAAAEDNRLDVATEVATSLDEIARRLDRDVYTSLALLGAGWAELASGAPQRAAGPAGDAARLLARTGCRAFLGRALDLLGHSLYAIDRAGAIEAFERAAAVFEACGATRRRDRALEALGRLGSRGRRTAAAALGPDSLTARERQVARLAAQGLTLRKIGERLFIGERTVETHLANVYAKLGVASKSELAGRAAKLGLQ